MEMIRALLKKPWLTVVLGFVLGLIIGLPVLGWGLWPVQWYDASPQHLRADAKEDYLRMAIESYIKSSDKAVALFRWTQLGPNANKVLEALTAKGNLQDIVKFSKEVVEAKGITPMPPSTGQTIKPTDAVKPSEPAKTAVATQSVTKPAATATKKAETKAAPIDPILLLGIFLLLLLVIGGALVYLLFLRKRGNGRQAAGGKEEPASHLVERTDYQAQGQEPPVAQFMTTYTIGDDLYDDSFSIDSPTGEFLGECGVGISDTIGVGDPKKVTAFEVWLFDKNDIQTVTKVLMSEHAFNDTAIRQRLASKGEPVLLEVGKRVLLETATLQLEARIVELNYGQGALPANSFVDRMTLELAIWPKIKA